ncbi:MAG: hypothetical protein ACJ8BE_07795 [Microvirga sp.]
MALERGRSPRNSRSLFRAGGSDRQMRRRKPQPGGVDPFRAALALEELDLPREAAERMREPKRAIVGTKRPWGLAIVHPA